MKKCRVNKKEHLRYKIPSRSNNNQISIVVLLFLKSCYRVEECKMVRKVYDFENLRKLSKGFVDDVID